MNKKMVYFHVCKVVRKRTTISVSSCGCLVRVEREIHIHLYRCRELNKRASNTGYWVLKDILFLLGSGIRMK
ncbi:hypothetical protein MKX03_026032 [Papaver bracteatum]|nr:hypothetical protein MKX03_026032 [Papaver bracteatum]